MAGLLGAYEDSSEEGDDAPSILAKAAAAAPATASSAADQGASSAAAEAGAKDAVEDASGAAAAKTGSVADASPPAEAPSSPHSGDEREEDMLAALPPSPEGPPDEDILERVRKLHDMRKQGRSIRDHIQGSRDWANPYILERVIKVFELSEHGSNYPRELYDPATAVEHPSDYFDAPDCERPPPPKRKRTRE